MGVELIEVQDQDQNQVSLSLSPSFPQLLPIIMETSSIPRRDSTASSTTLSTDSDSDATISKHRYPPKNFHDSDTSYKDHEGEESQVFLPGDDEENVGLMQNDRDQGSTSKRKVKSSKLTGPFIFLSVLLLVGLSIPLISWLSTSTTTTTSNLNSLSTLPSSSSSKRPRPKVTKLSPTSNDEIGNYGLTKSKDFNLAFQFNGWKNVKSGIQSMSFKNQNSLEYGLTMIDEKKVKERVARNGGLKRLDMDTIFNGTFNPKSSDLNWCAEDPDVGVFSYSNYQGDIILEDVTHLRKSKTGKGEIAKGGGLSEYVKGKNVRNEKGERIMWNQFKLSSDMMKIIFRSDSRKQWRHSTLSNFWIHDVITSQTIPLGLPTSKPTISHASFSPPSLSSKSQSIAFVQNNNLYLQLSTSSKPIQITKDGSETTFNGIPDWVYEEEIFASDFSYWFSKDGKYLLYLSFDEMKVPVYDYPIYNPNEWVSGQTRPYLKNKEMKYPKPGFENPLVSLKVVDIDSLRKSNRTGQTEVDVENSKINLVDPITSNSNQFDKDFEGLLKDGIQGRGKGFGRLIVEVAWLGGNQVLVREFNRQSDMSRILLFDMQKIGRDISKGGVGGEDKEVVGEVVRRIDERNKGGWIESAQTIKSLSDPTSTAYLDEVITPEGFLHIAYFENSRSSEPKFLTSGNWEISKGEISKAIKHVDEKRGKIYFAAALNHPAQRHVYSIDLPKSASAARIQSPKPLTNDKIPGNFDISVDPKGAYYILYSLGTSTEPPFQKVIGVDDTEFSLILEDNKELKELSLTYSSPQTVFYNLTTSSNIVTLVQEIRPSDFDPSGKTKYPVLIHFYGGPNSQQGTLKYSRNDWHQFLVENLGYIICIVDSRGTGLRGQNFRSQVTKQLGKLEALDAVQSAEKLATLPYVDEARIGVWGWSYGGYLTCKIVEFDSDFISLGMAVAPVTNWKFYDSIYTERYMKDPISNSQGYANSSVHVTNGFRNSHFLLAQGSGDDNVHFSNSAHLLDLLTAEQVRDFRFRMFTDSDHSISMRGAFRELHEFMIQALRDWWGPGGKRQ